MWVSLLLGGLKHGKIHFLSPIFRHSSAKQVGSLAGERLMATEVAELGCVQGKGSSLQVVFAVDSTVVK